MEKRTLGRTGLEVTPLGFGSAQIGLLNADPVAAGRMMNQLLDAGINVVDTAAAYAEAEAVIGQQLSHRRAEYVLISKCGRGVDGVSAPDWSAELIEATVDRALRRLRTTHLDVMLLHSCDLETLSKGEALGALVKAQRAGKVRHVGYSGDNETAAAACEMDAVSVVEMSVSIADQRNIDLALPAARRRNVGVIAKRPIANAAWKDLARQEGMYQSYAKEYHDRLKAMKLMPGELGFGGAAEQAWPEIALRFTLGIEGVHTAIIGTTKVDNAMANMGFADKGPLPAEATAKIRAAFAKADPGGRWVGQT